MNTEKACFSALDHLLFPARIRFNKASSHTNYLLRKQGKSLSLWKRLGPISPISVRVLSGMGIKGLVFIGWGTIGF